eukprot:4558628-Amphidinium_carterae.1
MLEHLRSKAHTAYLQAFRYAGEPPKMLYSIDAEGGTQSARALVCLLASDSQAELRPSHRRRNAGMRVHITAWTKLISLRHA